jgi:prepilin-type N-terminal cleavage/methylation domain-containing protein
MTTGRRAFSLLEVMVVVAILGILTAIAAPNLLVEVQKARLAGAAESVASFIARAQNDAQVSRRCVRVFAVGTRTLVAERLNVFDCDNDPSTARRIDPTVASLFVNVGQLRLESDKLEVFMNGTNGSVVPSDCAAASPPGFGANELRFRPNGRVFTQDQDFTDDDGILSVRHTSLPAAQQFVRILVNGNGLICVFPRGQVPVAVGGDFSCP